MKKYRLAINGGNPVRKRPFPHFPITDGKEINSIKKVLKSDEWTYGLGGPEKNHFGYDFERRFAEYHQAKHGILVSNGTAAIEVALKAVGVLPGDEVILQAYTCFSDVGAILQVNALPVFVDIDPQTYCIDVSKIEENITRHTKAILAIHWGGRPSDMDAIGRIARRHHLSVIEDVCVAQGAEWKGRKVGNFGELGAFSFGCGKLIQCGEGGIITANSGKLADACYDLRDRGRRKHDAYTIGWNYRISEILSAVLIEQLAKYPGQLEARNRNAPYLSKELGKVKGIRLLNDDPRITKQGYSIFFFKIDEQEFGIGKKRFLEALGAEGIPAWGGHPPAYSNSLLRKNLLYKHLPCLRHKIDYSGVYCPETEKACFREAICLPHACLLGNKDDMDDIVKAVVKIRENTGELK